MRAKTNLPFDIQVEIIKRVLPVKSLVRFRSVSKQWKSLIDSPKFIAHHTFNQAHPHHLLLSPHEDNYVCIVGDDTFPMHKFSPIGYPVFKQRNLELLDCSPGLVCVHNNTDRVVLWNPSIRKSVDIMLPIGNYVFGCWVCPKTIDPKIVKLTMTFDLKCPYDYTAEVYTLSSGAWRSISINMSLRGVRFRGNPVVIDGIIYWFTRDVIKTKRRKRIISFDLTREEFGEIVVPDTFTQAVYISKIDKSLVVLDGYGIVESGLEKPACDVWVLKNGSFRKLYTVKVCPKNILGFRENGEAILEQDGYPRKELQVYDPYSEQMKGLGINGWGVRMTSYTESLLLLNH